MKPISERTPDGWRYTYTETSPHIGIDVHRIPGRDDAGEVTAWALGDGEVWIQASSPTRVEMLNATSRSLLVRHLQGRRIGKDIDWSIIIEQVCTYTLRARGGGGMVAPKTHRIADLIRKQLPRRAQVVPGILPEGLYILGGRPKSGKSWMALNLCLAVSAGGMAFGSKSVERGGALYLALEDGELRLQERVLSTPGGHLAAVGFEYVTEWTALAAGGEVELDLWLTAHPGTRLVVIDTLAKAQGRTADNSSSRLYEQDYHALAGLQSLATKHHCAIVVLHHLRKSGSEDPVEMLSGTMGLSGAADGILVLERRRSSPNATLHIISRDLPADQELALGWDDTLKQWNIKGDAEQVRNASGRTAVLDWLLEAGEPQNARDIEAVTGIAGGTVRRALSFLLKQGDAVLTARGTYSASVAAREAAKADHGAPKLDHSDSTVINGFGSDAPQNQKFDHSDQVIKSGGFEYENGDFDLITRDHSDQVFAPDTNGNEDDDHLITVIKSFDLPPETAHLCPACGQPRGPTDYCAACRERLCQVCGEETGSVMRGRCVRCAMKET